MDPGKDSFIPYYYIQMDKYDANALNGTEMNITTSKTSDEPYFNGTLPSLILFPYGSTKPKNIKIPPLVDPNNEKMSLIITNLNSTYMTHDKEES